MSTLLTQLCDWYSENCDQDWEHQCGVKIDTLDNPGWTIEIDLAGTRLESVPVPIFENHRTEHDWLVVQECKNINGRTYRSAGGPNNLEEIITRFLEWTSNAEPKANHDHHAHD